MPQTTLTQLAVDRLKPPPEGSVIHWDKTLPGFGVRVSAKGRKTWIGMYRVDGKSVMETLGTIATVPLVKDAREKARQSMVKARAGNNPVEERRAKKAQRAADQVAAAAAAKEAVEGRFEAVAGRFLQEHIERNCSSKYAGEVRRIFERDVLPRWGGRAIRSITKHDVNELLDIKASRRERARKGTEGGAAIQANRTLTRLRTFFAWAAGQDLIDADPSAGVLLRGKERARDRVLEDDELLWFWRGAERAGWPYGAIFKLLLLTAQREGEIAGMRWSELDLDKRTWIIPRERAKSDRAHIVHLSDLAAEIINTLPRMAGDLVFPSRAGTQVSSFSKQKERLDATMTAQKCEATANSDAQIGPWVIHDLRRTATTLMARLNVPPHVADKVLNHSAGTIRGVAAVYNRHAYLDERKAALEALGRYVAELVRPGATGNVVSLRQPA
jgi:integrase